MEKPGDPAGEPRRRARALAELRSAIADETRVRDRAARSTAARAETAMWLGASLADLATITGHSRQAARKRWPGLGSVTRRRRWLSHHVDEIFWAARLVLDHADELPPESTVGLSGSVDRATTAFADTSVHDTDPVAHWHLLEALVDHHLRAAADASGSARTGQAQFARDGAHGVVAYYDHAISQAAADA